LYGKLKRGKTLTTQVVRRSHFKKRRRASSKVEENHNYHRGKAEDERKNKLQP
jgi:hypothetical protein